MKKRTLVVPFFVLCVGLLQAQTYQPIPTHAEWRYRFFRIWQYPGNCSYDDGMYITKGVDTLIDNKIYQVVYYRGKVSA